MLVRDFRKLLASFDFSEVILSSTRKKDEVLARNIRKHCKLVVLSHLTKLPIKLNYKTPKTLGRDRIAAVVGAHHMFPKSSNLVVDAGSCITFDFIDNKGEYHGGNISPGLWMRTKAMNDYSANLPIVPLKHTSTLLGNSTKSALQNGTILHTICEIEAFIDRCRHVYGRINVILTGGDARFLADNFKKKIFVDSNLILKGLNEILLYNAK